MLDDLQQAQDQGGPVLRSDVGQDRVHALNIGTTTPSICASPGVIEKFRGWRRKCWMISRLHLPWGQPARAPRAPGPGRTWATWGSVPLVGRQPATAGGQEPDKPADGVSEITDNYGDATRFYHAFHRDNGVSYKSDCPICNK